MALARLAVALLLHLLLAASCCAGRDFVVGGRAGWTTHPAEPFNTWAERNRFQVNDSLVFRYSDHSDSVMAVSQSHYDACNTTDPYVHLEGGHNVFGLARSGPYFFISGDAKRCQAGEHLIVVVLAVRAGSGSPSPSTKPSPPKSKPPSSSPPPVPAPAGSQATPPPAAGNSSSTPPPPAGSSSSTPPPPPSSTPPSPALAPPPATNATVSPPPHSPSSASALRGGVLAFIVIVGAIVLA
ncbi:hypothetical protein QYE76_050975 [Lolium multiflorum]|uniref:Phytocyanin domain-containing protein n=1 Tax=Lolium multiflorum TaxID=4521 RepID=A0AAD8WIB3_LOLMU|nr:hypothetical protein QYE76_050975 [Lolium multiflorum]